ncbi:MAG: polysaccharide deacetylase family protein [Clostridia bacterium]|nr:polysaccharide deacetylase family protein [Clostridia bacterium]
MKKALFVLCLAVLTVQVVFAREIIANNSSATKKIALTFDDGPHPKHTEEILDILKEYGVKATFFIIGSNAQKHPDIVKRTFDEGHELGNHTYNHVFINRISDDKLREEISKTDEIIKQITGTAPIVFRPPGGAYNDLKVDVVSATGHKCILWSWWQDTRDWSCPPVDKVVNTVLSNLHDGDIILFHDFNNGNTPTAKALRIIIPRLIEMDYEFVSVSELIQSEV